MKQPVITTVIPTYRRPQFLKRAVESVLAQTYPHFRVCVYDNCSQDETRTVVRDLMGKDSRVQYHCHEKNIGAVANFHYALERISSDYFTILSDDDWLLPAFFENALRLVDQYPEASFAALSCRIERDGRVVRFPLINQRIKGFHMPPKGFLLMLNNWAVLTWTSILFQRGVLDEIGYPLQEPCMPNDLEFLLRIAAHNAVVISDIEGAVFTDHPDSASSKSDLHWIWPCYLHVIEYVMKTYKLDTQSLREAKGLLYTRFQKRLAYCVISSLHQKNWAQAEKALLVFSQYDQRKSFCILKTLMRLTQQSPRLVHPLLTRFIQNKHTVVYLLDWVRSRAHSNHSKGTGHPGLPR